MYPSDIKIKPPIFNDPSFCQEKKYLKEFKLRTIILRFAPGIMIYSLIQNSTKKNIIIRIQKK